MAGAAPGSGHAAFLAERAELLLHQASAAGLTTRWAQAQQAEMPVLPCRPLHAWTAHDARTAQPSLNPLCLSPCLCTTTLQGSVPGVPGPPLPCGPGRACPHV
jgi:hypothetical protein